MGEGTLNKIKLIILSIFIALCSTGCKDKENDKKHSGRQWINHPHEALRFPRYGLFKYTMTGHDLYDDDSGLFVRNAIMDIDYNTFVKVSDDSVVKSNNKLEYVVCYGDYLNQVLASMIFYDNGYISMTNYNDDKYSFKLPEPTIKNVFDVGNNKLTAIENEAISQETLAIEACTPEKFMSFYENNGSKAHWHIDGYIVTDNSSNEISNCLKTITYKKKSQKTIDEYYTGGKNMFSEDYDLEYYIDDHYFCLLNKSRDSITFCKLYFDNKKGEYRFNLSIYSISKSDGDYLYSCCEGQIRRVSDN